MKKYIVLFAVVIFIFGNCTKDVYSPDVCFQENVLPIFVSNCTFSGCHNASDREAGYDLTNYDGIMRGVSAKHPLFSEVYTTVKGNNPSMPLNPYPKLSTRDVSIIKIWIEMGANNTSNCKTCDTTNFTYKKRIDDIMQTFCKGCHNASTASGGVNLADYTGVVNSIAGNKLLGSVQHISGLSPMPKNGNKLNDCDIIAIRNWIESGNPNN